MSLLTGHALVSCVILFSAPIGRRCSVCADESHILNCLRASRLHLHSVSNSRPLYLEECGISEQRSMFNSKATLARSWFFCGCGHLPFPALCLILVFLPLMNRRLHSTWRTSFVTFMHGTINLRNTGSFLLPVGQIMYQ